MLLVNCGSQRKTKAHLERVVRAGEYDDPLKHLSISCKASGF